MALVTSRTGLSQGTSSLAATDVAWTSSAGANTVLTSGALMPNYSVNEIFEVRSSPIAGNNGLYIATGSPTASSLPCTKIFGAAPIDDAAEAVEFLGTGGGSPDKSMFIDAQGLGVAIIEQGNVDAAGVVGQATYSFLMQEYKDDSYLIANAPFPMLAIDSDAGKYIIGQDISGNNNGFNWLDDNATAVEIRTRKMHRNMGWDEVNAGGITTARSVGVTTLGVFENALDTAYYQFGNDTTVDDTVDFTFSDAVNEAVEFYKEQAQPGSLNIATTTITRTGGSFITEGYKVGGQVTIRAAEDAGNNATFLLTAVSATVLTTTGLTANAADTTAILAVDNGNAMTLRLRVRDADPKGKTFAQADLTSAGKLVLGNFVYAFPLANGADQKIDVTDVGIDANSDGIPDVAPYTGMSITFLAAPTARTDLVGGSANFGIIIDGNLGTSQEAFEFVQWSLRSTGGNGTGDIDDDGDTAIGRAMDGLARFVGDTGEFGTPDGLNFPTNPNGGGSGVYVDNLAAVSKNSVIFYDNTNAPLQFPETIQVTLDFNQIALDDSEVEYDLFYDRTVRSSPTGVTLTATTDVLAGTGLPNTAGVGVGSYIRIAGLADATMDGVYQIVTETTPGASWVVARYDGAVITTVGSSTPTMDINCVDTPDFIHVHTNVRAAGTASLAPVGTAVISFTAPDTIADTQSLFGGFVSGDIIQIEGTTAQDGTYTVDTAVAGTITLVEQTITTESTATSNSITKIVSGVNPSIDYSFSYDFSNNSQGDRSGTAQVEVKAKAVGAAGAQYVQSSVASIVTGTPLTIPVAPATERNYA